MPLIRWFHFPLVCCALLLPGCATDRHQTEEERKMEQQSKQMREQLNDQWLAGYGFNNPNPERKRQGRPLVNFDGSEVKPESTSFLGSLLEGLFSGE